MNTSRRSLMVVFMAVTIWISQAFGQGWSTAQTISTSSSNRYPAIAVDNLPVDFGSHQEGYGRAHISWCLQSDSYWNTCYRGVKADGTLTDIEEVSRDPIGGTGGPQEYKSYPSDIVTRPDIVVDNDDDAADIVFLFQREDWFYTEVSENSTLVSEILFSWKTPIDWTGTDEIDPPDYLHHVTGLQIGVDDPFIDYMGLKAHQRYLNVVAWSQDDPLDPGENTPLYNYQQTAANRDRDGIDWGDITRASEITSSNGEHPYAAVAFDRSENDPHSSDANVMAVVSVLGSGGLKCSFCNIPSVANTHSWTTFTKSGEISAVSCDFDDSEPPVLYIAFTKNSGGTKQYIYCTINPWSDSPSFSKETVIANASSTYKTRPVIKFTEDGTRYIAYIGSDDHVYVKKDSDTPTQLTSGPAEHAWVDLAVDDVSLSNGYCPQVVYEEVMPLDTETRTIKYRRYFK